MMDTHIDEEDTLSSLAASYSKRGPGLLEEVLRLRTLHGEELHPGDEGGEVH